MNNATRSLLSQIGSLKEELARRIVDEHWAINPQFHEVYGELGHAQRLQDVTTNLAYLSESISAGSPRLFEAYVEWVKVLFKGLGIPREELVETLKITGDVLSQRFPDSTSLIKTYLAAANKQLASESHDEQGFLEDPSNPHGSLARQYLDLLRHGHRTECSQLILSAVEQGIGVKDIYLNVFQPCQRETGRLWQTNQLSVAEEHYCTAATQLIMAQLSPHIFGSKRIGKCLVATCVGAELHEIGLRMVADFLEMEGWDTYYLGSNTPNVSIIQALTARNADLLLISATMTFHVNLVSNLIEEVRDSFAQSDISILVGGYPFNIEPELWKQVGADGYASSALEAVDAANQLASM